MGNSLCSTWKSRSDFGENWKGAPPFVSRQCFPNIDPGYLILIAVFYQIILFLGGSTFLGGFELVGKVHYFWDWAPNLLDAGLMESLSWRQP